MKISISNISWDSSEDKMIYELMQNNGFSGLEIAPTRVFPEHPYDRLESATEWAEGLKNQYGFSIPSMQSIWFGRQEKLFGTEEERKVLVDYTKKAIDFSAAVGCGNLVFGCPRNRNMPDGADVQIGVDFFRTIGEYALSRGTVIGMEANPSIYNTNYINDTPSALRLIEEVDSEGFRLNLDVGTMIYSGERVEILKNKVHLISHVHISEPGLKPIVHRSLHEELKELLRMEDYSGFVSIEMGKTEHPGSLVEAALYVREVFAGER